MFHLEGPLGWGGEPSAGHPPARTPGWSSPSHPEVANGGRASGEDMPPLASAAESIIEDFAVGDLFFWTSSKLVFSYTFSLPCAGREAVCRGPALHQAQMFLDVTSLYISIYIIY